MKPDFVTRANQIVAERDRLRTELEAARAWKEELGKRLNTQPIHILDIISDWEDKLDELEELREQARWIPVTERLPEVGQIVEARIQMLDGVNICTPTYDPGLDGRWRWCYDTPTHWRPMPDLPLPAPAEGGEG
jgi:hypothetical protein